MSFNSSRGLQNARSFSLTPDVYPFVKNLGREESSKVKQAAMLFQTFSKVYLAAFPELP